MLSTDREEFRQLLKTLCAGFEVPMTAAREDAMWRGFNRSTLAEFAHLIDLALEDDELAGYPSVNALRGMKAKRRATEAAQRASQSQAPREELDTLLAFANRLCFRLMRQCGGFGSKSRYDAAAKDGPLVDIEPSDLLHQVRAAIHALIDWFSPGVTEGDPDATPALFVEMFAKAMGNLMAPPRAAVKDWAEFVQLPTSQAPFPSYMARDYRPAPPALELVP